MYVKKHKTDSVAICVHKSFRVTRALAVGVTVGSLGGEFVSRCRGRFATPQIAYIAVASLWEEEDSTVVLKKLCAVILVAWRCPHLARTAVFLRNMHSVV